MSHPTVQKLLGELKRAVFPYFTTDTQVICGRITFTFSPSVESDVIHTIRLDLPSDVQPTEGHYWVLFLVTVFSSATFCEIQPRMKEFLRATGVFTEVIGEWRLRMFTEDGHRVAVAEAMSLQ